MAVTTWTQVKLYGNLSVTTGIGKNNENYKGFRLGQNFPNPFNTSTTLEYFLSDEGNVSLKIFNMLGNEVAVLAEEYKLPGQYRVTFDATGIPSGIYLCKLNVDDFMLTRKLILIK